MSWICCSHDWAVHLSCSKGKQPLLPLLTCQMALSPWSFIANNAWRLTIFITVGHKNVCFSMDCPQINDCNFLKIFFQSETTVGKLRTPANWKFAKISCTRIAYGPNSRKFPVAKISCSTVYEMGKKESYRRMEQVNLKDVLHRYRSLSIFV